MLHRGETMRPILMIDDEKDLCDSLARILRREFPKIPIHNITQPVEGLSWLAQHQPSMLITDLRMPEVSGLELITQAASRWGTIPTIIMTAFASPELDQILHLGAIHYLPKPFRSQKLIQLVRHVIEHNPSTIQTPTHHSPSMLIDMIQLHALACSNGTLKINNAQHSGTICFSKGHIVHADDGRQTGTIAFENILKWRKHQFSFVEGAKFYQETIKTSTPALLSDAIMTLDKQKQEENISHPFPKDPPSSPFFISPSSADLEAASLSSISVHNFDQSLDRLKGLGGFIGAYIIDLNNKRILASRGNAKSRWDISIPDQCTFFNKKRNVLKRLGECGSLEEITVTSEVTFQMYRNSSQYPHILFFLLLERASTNLDYARLVLLETEKQLVLAAH